MSSQSGISAEQELVDVLHDPSQGSQRLRIVTAGVSDDFTSMPLKGVYDSLSELQSKLDNEPLYVFIKDIQKNPNQYVFISYVPDSSPVKLKMLYASTKNTLVRQIGGNLIGKQLLVTDKADLEDALQSQDLDPQQNATLLTESEKAEIEISQQQQRMKLGNRKLVSQSGGSPGSLVFNVESGDSTIHDLLKQFNVIYCKIDLDSERIQVVDKSNIKEPAELKIIPEDPSYTIYRNGSLNYFIYSCPSGSKVKERMVYASNRLGFINHLKDQDKLEFARIVEIGDPEDLELSLISNSSEEEQNQEKAEEANARSASSRKFNKPKGPGRRR